MAFQLIKYPIFLFFLVLAIYSGLQWYMSVLTVGPKNYILDVGQNNYKEKDVRKFVLFLDSFGYKSDFMPEFYKVSADLYVLLFQFNRTDKEYLDEAIGRYKKSLISRPCWGEVWGLLAQAYWLRGEWFGKGDEALRQSMICGKFDADSQRQYIYQSFKVWRFLPYDLKDMAIHGADHYSTYDARGLLLEAKKMNHLEVVRPFYIKSQYKINLYQQIVGVRP